MQLDIGHHEEAVADKDSAEFGSRPRNVVGANFNGPFDEVLDALVLAKHVLRAQLGDLDVNSKQVRGVSRKV